MSWNKRHPAAFADRVISVTTTSAAIDGLTLNVLCAVGAAATASARCVLVRSPPPSLPAADASNPPPCSHLISALLVALAPWRTLALTPGAAVSHARGPGSTLCIPLHCMPDGLRMADTGTTLKPYVPQISSRWPAGLLPWCFQSALRIFLHAGAPRARLWWSESSQ